MINEKLYNIINELGSTTKRKEKQTILSKVINDQDLITFIKAVYDPNKNYFLKAIPNSYIGEGNCIHENIDIMDAIELLDTHVVSRETTGNNAKNFIFSLYDALDEYGKYLLKLVFKRDLACGVGVKTINDVAGYEVVYVPPYMRCSGFSQASLKKLSFPVVSQTKMDGAFVNILIDNMDVSVKVLTRSGQDITTSVKPDVDAFVTSSVSTNAEYEGLVLMGEILVKDGNGGYLPREIGNGYINSGDVNPELIEYVIWDSVTLPEFISRKSDRPYYSEHESCRFGDVIDFVKNAGKNGSVKLVRSIICNSVDDVIEHFKSERENNNEGTVIKDYNLLWVDGVSKLQVKVKVIFDADLLCIDVVEGEYKNAGKLGSLTLTSSDGSVIVSCGTGLSDAQREEFWANPEAIIGKIAAIKANDITVTSTSNENEDGGTTYSLFLPRFIEFRNDKTVADDVVKIKEQVKSFTDALKLLEA